MRKTLIVFFALILFLSSCGSTGQGKTDVRTIDTNRSYVHYVQIIMATETADTIYFIGRMNDSFIKYVDKATGITGPLCGRPECGHNDGNCNAYAGTPEGNLGLFIYNERIYWVSMGNSRTGFLIGSVALDGTDRREMSGLEGDLYPGSAGNGYAMLHDGYIYFSCIRGDIENGVRVDYNYVCAIPLDSNEEPFVILKEKTDHNNYLAMQPYGNELYIITDDLCGTLEQAQETGRYRYHFRLRRWNMESFEMETLYEENESELAYPKELWAMDDGVLFCGYSNEREEMGIYKYDFETGECSYLFSTGITGLILSGIADNIVTGYDLKNNDGIYDIRVVIKDFEGNALVDDSYTLDLRDECPHYSRYEMDLLGRDETNVYYSLNGDNGTRYVTIVSVALDGSGARALCTYADLK